MKIADCTLVDVSNKLLAELIYASFIHSLVVCHERDYTHHSTLFFCEAALEHVLHTLEKSFPEACAVKLRVTSDGEDYMLLGDNDLTDDLLGLLQDDVPKYD